MCTNTTRLGSVKKNLLFLLSRPLFFHAVVVCRVQMNYTWHVEFFDINEKFVMAWNKPLRACVLPTKNAHGAHTHTHPNAWNETDIEKITETMIKMKWLISVANICRIQWCTDSTVNTHTHTRSHDARTLKLFSHNSILSQLLVAIVSNDRNTIKL